jgi:transposase-like protein
MSKDKSQLTPKQVETDSKSVLEDICRKGARRCLAAALEAEVDEFMNSMSTKRDENGHCLAVRNGYHKERPLMTGMGPVNSKQPRVDDRNVQKRYPHIKFQSDIVPEYLRRVPSLDILIPALYLKGVSPRVFSGSTGSEYRVIQLNMYQPTRSSVSNRPGLKSIMNGQNAISDKK